MGHARARYRFRVRAALGEPGTDGCLSRMAAANRGRARVLLVPASARRRGFETPLLRPAAALPQGAEQPPRCSVSSRAACAEQDARSSREAGGRPRPLRSRWEACDLGEHALLPTAAGGSTPSWRIRPAMSNTLGSGALRPCRRGTRGSPRRRSRLPSRPGGSSRPVCVPKPRPGLRLAGMDERPLAHVEPKVRIVSRITRARRPARASFWATPSRHRRCRQS